MYSSLTTYHSRMAVTAMREMLNGVASYFGEIQLAQ